MMSYKRWIITIVVFTLVLCMFFMGINYYGDAFDYFGAMKGTVDSTSGYKRVVKPQYIKRNSEKYNAVVIGGSKAGALNVETLNEQTGLNFYNSYFVIGCFRDYLAYTQYYLETMDLEEIVLHISSFEINYYEPLENSKMLNLPAVVTGESIIKEEASFLVLNVDESVKKIIKKLSDKKFDSFEDKIDGEMDLTQYYNTDAEMIVRDSVLKNYETNLECLCISEERNTSAYEDNIKALDKIKELCVEKGVRLTVIIGAGFVGEKYQYEGEVFYDYLRDIVEITEVYDFGGFYDVNMNPYNFYNDEHYYYEVGDEMIRIVYGGKENTEFGTLLTKDNIDDYISFRREVYAKIVEEYKTTGTVELEGRDAKSNLCR